MDMTNATDPALILSRVCAALLLGQPNVASAILKTEYPFEITERQSRAYSEDTKMRLFMRDGFIDRYTGKKLVFSGTLRLLSHLMPDAFPYHPNWKMDASHRAYWELTPTLDHVVPIARGGSNAPDNLVTTSMLNNKRKDNWTLEDMGWTVYPPGNMAEWDGLVGVFRSILSADSALLAHPFIRKYNRIVQAADATGKK